MFEMLGWIADHSWDITLIVLLLFAGLAPIICAGLLITTLAV